MWIFEVLYTTEAGFAMSKKNIDKIKMKTNNMKEGDEATTTCVF